MKNGTGSARILKGDFSNLDIVLSDIRRAAKKNMVSILLEKPEKGSRKAAFQKRWDRELKQRWNRSRAASLIYEDEEIREQAQKAEWEASEFVAQEIILDRLDGDVLSEIEGEGKAWQMYEALRNICGISGLDMREQKEKELNNTLKGWSKATGMTAHLLAVYKAFKAYNSAAKGTGRAMDKSELQLKVLRNLKDKKDPSRFQLEKQSLKDKIAEFEKDNVGKDEDEKEHMSWQDFKSVLILKETEYLGEESSASESEEDSTEGKDNKKVGDAQVSTQNNANVLKQVLEQQNVMLQMMSQQMAMITRQQQNGWGGRGNGNNGGNNGGNRNRNNKNNNKKKCFQFEENGSCSWGDKCRFSHQE